MSQQREIVIDIDDPDRRGFFRDFDSTVKSPIGINGRHAGMRFKARLGRRSETLIRPFDDVNTDGATIEICMGEPDKPVTAGTFLLSYLADSTGLTVLAFDITAAALEAALNANPAVLAAGEVDVETLSANAFSVTFRLVGARSLFGQSGANLFPEAQVGVSRDTTGDAGTREVQIVRLVRRPYAYTSNFESSVDGSVTITERQAGTATKKSVQRVQLSAGVIPYDGNLILNFPRPEITDIACRANTAAKEKTTITLAAFDAGGAENAALSGKSFLLYTSANVPKLVWLDLANGSVVPPTPTGGAKIEVDYATTDNSEAVANKINAAIDADASFVGLIAGNTIIVENAAAGACTASEDVNTGFGIVQTTAGTNGVLDLKTFIASDEDGTVGVWMNASSATVPPAAALECARQLSVTLAAGDTVTTVATAVKNALDADGNFAAALINSNTGVRLTDSDGGERAASADADTTFAITQKQSGKSISANFPWDATAEEIQAEFENYFQVIRSNPRFFDLKARQIGAQPAITIDASDMTFSNIVEAEMNLATAAMMKRFAEDEEPFAELVFEGWVTFPDSLPHLFAREVVKIYRSVLDDGVLGPSPSVSGWLVDAPAANDSVGTRGQIALTEDGLYYCFATGTDATPRWRAIIGSETIPIP